MENFKKAAEIIRRNPSKSFFAGAKSLSLLEKMEEVIGYPFPPTYRAFLAEFGAGNFGAMEFFGVIDEDVEDSSVPDGVWYTLTERREVHLPEYLFVVGETGTGELYCLRLEKSYTEDAPVIIVNPGADPAHQEGELVASDFGSFLLDRVNRA
jgi:hypothetical protein